MCPHTSLYMVKLALELIPLLPHARVALFLFLVFFFLVIHTHTHTHTHTQHTDTDTAAATATATDGHTDTVGNLKLEQYVT